MIAMTILEAIAVARDLLQLAQQVQTAALDAQAAGNSTVSVVDLQSKDNIARDLLERAVSRVQSSTPTTGSSS